MSTATLRPAALLVIDPSGNKSRVPIRPLPFKIGRQADSNLVLLDARNSRNHARIIAEGGDYFIEDQGSRQGVFVNGTRVERHKLRNSDRIDFGLADSYQLIFSPAANSEVTHLLEKLPAPAESGGTGVQNLARLRALLDVARAAQTSLTTDGVLTAVVDAALSVTGAERGFLLLRQGEGLEVRIARDKQGNALADSELRVPRKVIHRALNERPSLLSMSFDPAGATGQRPEETVALLDLRSVLAVPLVRASLGTASRAEENTVGLLYMDSRIGSVDLATGNRELLEALALEASNILENARLLDEERDKQRLEEELGIARRIQESLLPRRLPESGWFCAAGKSIASEQVGGDYFDVRQIAPSAWATVVADVSGKGVSSALVAALLQGVFLSASDDHRQMEETLTRLNRFLLEKTEGDKYATVFFCTLDKTGLLRWINAGQGTPLLVTPTGELHPLRSNATPIGMLEEAVYSVQETKVDPGSKLLIYSDGVSEAQDPSGQFFGDARIRDTVRARASTSCHDLCAALDQALRDFTQSAPQSDDVTIVVIEFRP